MSKFYCDCLTTCGRRTLPAQARKPLASGLLFKLVRAEAADGKRTKGNFSPVLFVLGVTKINSENGYDHE